MSHPCSTTPCINRCYSDTTTIVSPSGDNGCCSCHFIPLQYSPCTPRKINPKSSENVSLVSQHKGCRQHWHRGQPHQDRSCCTPTLERGVSLLRGVNICLVEGGGVAASVGVPIGTEEHNRSPSQRVGGSEGLRRGLIRTPPRFTGGRDPPPPPLLNAGVKTS